MAMIYENAVKAWASQKVDVPVDQIEKVDFDIETWPDGSSYGDSWDDTPYVEVCIVLVGGENKTITYDRYDFPTILEEVISAGNGWKV